MWKRRNIVYLHQSYLHRKNNHRWIILQSYHSLKKINSHYHQKSNNNLNEVILSFSNQTFICNYLLYFFYVGSLCLQYSLSQNDQTDETTLVLHGEKKKHFFFFSSWILIWIDLHFLVLRAKRLTMIDSHGVSHPCLNTFVKVTRNGEKKKCIWLFYSSIRFILGHFIESIRSMFKSDLRK